MRLPVGRLSLAALLLASSALPVAADGITDAFRIIETARVGAFAHNPGNREEGTVDASFQVITSQIGTPYDNAFADFFFRPRFHAGAMVNTDGLTSYGYAGLTWRFETSMGLFAEFDFGGAFNNGVDRSTPDRVYLGCDVTFRESAGVGYRFSKSFDILASIEHISHASLCSDANPGITNVGARIGYHF